MWARLKGHGKIGGKKRLADSNQELESEGLGNSPKRSRVSLNVSSACERLENIILRSGSRESSLNVSQTSDEVFIDAELCNIHLRKTSENPKQAPCAIQSLRKPSANPKQAPCAIQSLRKTS